MGDKLLSLTFLLSAMTSPVISQSTFWHTNDPNAELKPRLVVMTDIGPDEIEPDDRQSAVRLLAYADRFEIEAIITTVGWNCDPYPSGWAAYLDTVINAYQADLPNLMKRSAQTIFESAADEQLMPQPLGYWPSPDYIRSRSLMGSRHAGIGRIGEGNDSPGSALIVRLLKENDPRPIGFCAWGSANTLAQAIWRLQQELDADEMQAIFDRIILYTITDQDMIWKMRKNRGYSSHQWMRREFATRFKQIWDESAWHNLADLGKRNWSDHQRLIQSQGSLGKAYPQYKYGVEGDTPSFLHFMPNGLNDPADPRQIGWGGLHAWGISPDGLTFAWTNWEKPLKDVSDLYEKGFFKDELNDFAARMQWAGTGSGTTNPVVIVNNEKGFAPMHISASPGEWIVLDASASFDPEGNNLTFGWWQQTENGVYRESLVDTPKHDPRLRLQIPDDSAGQSIHIVCEVHDDSPFQLVSYKRIIIDVRTPLPHLQTNRQGQTQLMVDGEPFLMLGGEIHNSTTGSVHKMDGVWSRLAAQNINTVIAPVSWELLEPEEGRYDYSILDAMIQGARSENLRLVLIWFGSWKNGFSHYVPSWVKQDSRRFPLALYSDGSKLPALSTHGNESMVADARAYRAMMEHLRQVDSNRHTVICVQIENEIGTLDEKAMSQGQANRAMRDYSPLANKAFAGNVPSQLIRYLKEHRKSLHPAIAEAWRQGGQREHGTWEEVFGKSHPCDKGLATQDPEAWKTDYPWLTEEIFNAWHYGVYVEEIAKAGKEVYPIPVYVNAWIKQSEGVEPGVYPSGGPQPHIFDIWHAAAPSVDLLGPDVYDTAIMDFILSGYDVPGNPVLMPETRPTPEGSARAFWAFGNYNMLCYAPFGVDGGSYNLNPIPGDNSLQLTYGVLKHLSSMILRYQGTSQIRGLYMQGTALPDPIQMGKYTLTMGRFDNKSAQAILGVSGDAIQKDLQPAGMIIIQTGEDSFTVAGGTGGCVLHISRTDSSQMADILYVDEISYDEFGRELRHRVNGDETAFGTCVIPNGEAKIFDVKMYEY